MLKMREINELLDINIKLKNDKMLIIFKFYFLKRELYQA